jgi:hypothetical protein
MLSSIVTLWMLEKLSAPAWCFIIAYAGLALSFIKFIIDIIQLAIKAIGK